MQNKIDRIVASSLELLQQHATSPDSELTRQAAGAFSLHSGQNEPDIYGMIDAAYILFILGKLEAYTTHASRQIWAERILACQDDDGWFSISNYRGHSSEHVTAYAIAALRLLELDDGETYVDRVKPISPLLPLLSNYDDFLHWIRYLNFRPTPQHILSKNLGWHHVWRGSHIGGGVAAIFGMMESKLDQWWPGQVDLATWFKWYFDWLDQNVSPTTGYWQRAFWNKVIRKPTMIDMGGAVHFYWMYDKVERPFPYPEAVVQSTIGLQKTNGLYRNHPFCIDFDGNFLAIRSYLQLSSKKQDHHRTPVYESAEKNFCAVANALADKPMSEIYSNLHGLPGALAALVECAQLPEFAYSSTVTDWHNPFEKVWWL